MNPETGATALQERQQFNLEAAQRQGEMLLAHGTDEGRQALTSELLQQSGNITLASEDFEGVSQEHMAEAQLRLAMGVATEAQQAGISATTTTEDLKTMYAGLFKDAADYSATKGQEGYNEDVAKAKQALAIGVWNKIETPAAADLSKW